MGLGFPFLSWGLGKDKGMVVVEEGGLVDSQSLNFRRNSVGNTSMIS